MVHILPLTPLDIPSLTRIAVYIFGAVAYVLAGAWLWARVIVDNARACHHEDDYLFLEGDARGALSVLLPKATYILCWPLFCVIGNVIRLVSVAEVLWARHTRQVRAAQNCNPLQKPAPHVSPRDGEHGTFY